MNAGSLRHRVTIQRPVRTTSTASGEALVTWRDVRTVWASVTPRSAVEIEQGRQQAHQVTHDVTIRYTPDMTPDHRFIFNGRTLNVTGLVNVENRNVELRATCAEVS